LCSCPTLKDDCARQMRADVPLQQCLVNTWRG
jgi:hypothetical protein